MEIRNFPPFCRTKTRKTFSTVAIYTVFSEAYELLGVENFHVFSHNFKKEPQNVQIPQNLPPICCFLTPFKKNSEKRNIFGCGN